MRWSVHSNHTGPSHWASLTIPHTLPPSYSAYSLTGMVSSSGEMICTQPPYRPFTLSSPTISRTLPPSNTTYSLTGMMSSSGEMIWTQQPYEGVAINLYTNAIIFKPSLRKHVCNPVWEFESSSCMRLWSMVTLATAETPHGTLLFLKACFHVQNSITSVLDIRQSSKIYHCIQQNQSANLQELYDANAFYVERTSEQNCPVMCKFSVIL